MWQKHPYGTGNQQGFSLIELMVAVSIIALLASILIPVVTTQINQARQVTAISQINALGNACSTWARNNGGNPLPTKVIDVTNYPTSLSADEVQDILGPDPANPMKNIYIASVPATDPWGNPYTFHYNPDVNGNPTQPQIFVIRSAGSDGVFSGQSYTRGDFDPGDFKSDIVWADGNLQGSNLRGN